MVFNVNYIKFVDYFKYIECTQDVKKHLDVESIWIIVENCEIQMNQNLINR